MSSHNESAKVGTINGLSKLLNDKTMINSHLFYCFGEGGIILCYPIEKLKVLLVMSGS